MEDGQEDKDREEEMRKAIAYIVLSLAAIMLFSCDVHEEPEGGDLINVTLNLEHDYGIEPWKTVDFQTRASSSGHTVRYIIRFYRYAGDSYEKVPAYEETLTGTDLENLDRQISVSVEPANYKVVAWTDYTNGSPYYEASDFAEISLTSTYSGDNEYRAAWYGSNDLMLADILDSYVSVEKTIPMQRPHARFRVIATDKDKFINYWATQLTIRSGSMVKDPSAVDISKFHVRYTYPQYLPSAFNLFSGRPVDAITGTTFDTSMTVNSDGSVSLGFDYVFVGSDEGSVVLSLSFYDENWEFISTVPNIEVPLRRSSLTTVTGRILTSGLSSGITIDPVYDGEFNVVI